MTRSYRTKSQDMSNAPRNFAKSFGPVLKTKKNGGGRGNWGANGIEVEDVNYNAAKPRRRSNVSTHAAGLTNFKSKFEVVEDEPVFIEWIHGPRSVPFEEDTENGYASDDALSLESFGTSFGRSDRTAVGW